MYIFLKPEQRTEVDTEYHLSIIQIKHSWSDDLGVESKKNKIK